MNLFVFGIGYSAGRFLRLMGGRFAGIVGTVRTADKVRGLARDGIEALLFDGQQADPRIGPALERADAVLVSVQPKSGREVDGRPAPASACGGDPVLARFEMALAQAPRLSRIVYLSTVGVYGDHGGAWIDEATLPRPLNGRGRVRLEVEDAWLDLGARTGRTVSVLRLAGIYGPGRNVLDDLREGTARRIDKAGQVFNRIHVDDIAQAAAAALERDRIEAPGVWNICDDEPAPAPDVVAFGASLLGLDAPPLIPFEGADLSAMARSFYGANRRIRNGAMKRDLGVRLLYPTYRQGLPALLRDPAGQPA